MAVQELELNALINAGVFQSKGEAVDEALRMLFVTRPQLRAEAAIHLFKSGEVTLGRAAEIAGLVRWEFEALLADRGIVRAIQVDSAVNLDRQAEQPARKE
jgi:predicted HTH domain antitoxin